MSRLTRDGTAELVSRDQILRRDRGQGNNIHFPCSADHEQDWQPYPVDPYSCDMCDHTYIHIDSVVSKYNTHKLFKKMNILLSVSCHPKVLFYNQYSQLSTANHLF